MTDRPDGRRPADPGRPDDGQWRPVDPPTRATSSHHPDPYQPNAFPPAGPPPAAPPTRAFDPYAPPDTYVAPDPYAAPGPVYGGPAYGPTQQFPGGPGYPPGYGAPATSDAPPPPSGGNGSRTAWLIAAIVALVVVVGLVAAYFVANRSTSADPSVTAGASVTESPPPQGDLLPPSVDIPTAPPDGGQSSAAPAPGQVLYQLSGSGQAVAVSYANGSAVTVAPTLITPPWSAAVTVDGDPSLTALVFGGPVTCTISRDGQVVTTATMSVGLLRCAPPAG